MRKTRGADAAAIRPVGAVCHQIDAELALRGLHRGVDLAFRHAIAFGVELEVVDQRFHRALHLAARGWHHLAVVGRYGATRHLLDALADDPHALAHLFHAADVTVETVAVPADRNVEIVLFVTVIGLRLAQIPGDA